VPIDISINFTFESVNGFNVQTAFKVASMAEEPLTPDDPAQSQRFINVARGVEAVESPNAIDRACDRVVPIKGSPRPAWLDRHPDQSPKKA
jgi:hypothetical protein